MRNESISNVSSFVLYDEQPKLFCLSTTSVDHRKCKKLQNETCTEARNVLLSLPVQQVCQAFEQQTATNLHSDHHSVPAFGKDFTTGDSCSRENVHSRTDKRAQHIQK